MSIWNCSNDQAVVVKGMRWMDTSLTHLSDAAPMIAMSIHHTQFLHSAITCCQKRECLGCLDIKRFFAEKCQPVYTAHKEKGGLWKSELFYLAIVRN